MSNQFLQMYFGLGTFTGLETQPTDNKTIVVDMDAFRLHMKDFIQKSEEKKMKSARSRAEG